MMTSSNGNIFHITGHLCREFTVTGEFPAQMPVTRSFDVFFDLNKQSSKQWWGWWLEIPSLQLWRHCNVWLCIIKFCKADTLVISNIYTHQHNILMILAILHIVPSHNGFTQKRRNPIHVLMALFLHITFCSWDDIMINNAFTYAHL